MENQKAKDKIIKKPKVIIAFRVPVDLKQSIQAICDKKGISISDYCISKLTIDSENEKAETENKTKIDWSKIDWNKFATLFAQTYIEHERQRHQRFKEYIRYEIFTPFYLKLWHKIIRKKTPKLY